MTQEASMSSAVDVVSHSTSVSNDRAVEELSHRYLLTSVGVLQQRRTRLGEVPRQTEKVSLYGILSPAVNRVRRMMSRRSRTR